jgi:hypothetical protein
VLPVQQRHVSKRLSVVLHIDVDSFEEAYQPGLAEVTCKDSRLEEFRSVWRPWTTALSHQGGTAEALPAPLPAQFR